MCRFESTNDLKASFKGVTRLSVVIFESRHYEFRSPALTDNIEE